jgi:autotransporter-associated beta strand protein
MGFSNKQRSGVLTLTGSLAYSGETAVSGETLQLRPGPESIGIQFVVDTRCGETSGSPVIGSAGVFGMSN